MTRRFHIAFPFEVAENLYRPGDYPASCTHPIPLAFTISHHCPASTAFRFIRQYYANTLLTIDLLEGHAPEPYTLVLHRRPTPRYMLAIVLDGRLLYEHPGIHLPVYHAPPGTTVFARLGGERYDISIQSLSFRMLLIGIHPAQLGVIGEDFDELDSLMRGGSDTADRLTPPVHADNLLMRRLIRFISPEGITCRKDFNLHLQQHLPGVCSAFKGLLRGKGQVHYDQEKLKEIINHISSYISENNRAPEPKAVASACYITPKKLERLFKTSMQCTPTAYISQQLLEAAGVYLLENPDLLIYEIADGFGYTDTAAFSKAFSKHHGRSPQAYRESIELSKNDTAR